ncbi:N-acetylglucosamine-6-phosphate deacetylase [Alkalihalobacillus deserti]|uniref:N-acetylglucosamine-6-phosphate deacetylase n=1 Tax=Alkalihalobacillus deserti TaxID=2879466 RepID=UPI001D147DB3|nr:N-acetylglucosamine-6-phosphate deacetylase [Alkalihalobacillus deserti]
MISNGNPILIKGGQLYTEDKIILNGYMKIKDQKIIELGAVNHLTMEEGFEVVDIPSHYKVIPGFIDIHIHGVNSADTMDATKDALHQMAKALPREGTTSFLATTITQNTKAIEEALVNVNEFIQTQQPPGKAEVIGIHLEGPFVNPTKAGAQPLEYIVDPNVENLKKWIELSGHNIRLVTLAPEQSRGMEMIRYLRDNAIISSIGHSDATYEQVIEAINAGANQVTHLFNQMRGIHHREPGVVGAAFLHGELKAEIIVDGIHVRPEMVKLAFQQKGKEGLILITDSMRAKWLANGQYDLGGQEVTVKEGKAVLEDGTLAGSILKLGEAVKNIQTFTGCSLEDAIVMASANPAKQINIFDKKGSLAEGKDADIVILDESLEVIMTFCRGERAFDQGGLTI